MDTPIRFHPLDTCIPGQGCIEVIFHEKGSVAVDPAQLDCQDWYALLEAISEVLKALAGHLRGGEQAPGDDVPWVCVRGTWVPQTQILRHMQAWLHASAMLIQN